MKFIITFLLLIQIPLYAKYQGKELVSNLGVVWGMDFINENKMILTIKDGRILLYDLKKKDTKILKQFEVYNKGQAGLLDVKISPNFKNDKTIYFTYVKNIDSKGATTLAKAKFEKDSLIDFEDILVTKSLTSKNVHFGSRITFDGKGNLYFGVGDRGVRSNAQNLKNHAGTIMRLNLDGTIPKDNPFVDDKNILDEIYSFGHRNPQGLFYDKVNKKLWEIEHGPRGGDEINLVQKAQNYGWPEVSWGKEYWNISSVGVKHKKGIEDAKKYYVPSIAPSSLVYYDGDIYEDLKGKLLAGALKSTHINILTLDKNFNIIKEDRILDKLGERIRHIAISPKGLIYFSTDSGKVYLLK